MAVVLDGNVKPGMWPLEPDLVAPEWGWFWEKFDYVQIALSGIPYDITNWIKEVVDVNNTSPAINSFGAALSGQLEHDWLASDASFPDTWTALTIVWVGRLANTTGDQMLVHLATGTGAAFGSGIALLRDDAVFGQPEIDVFRFRMPGGTDDVWTADGVANTLNPVVIVARWRASPNAISLKINGAEAAKQVLGGLSSFAGSVHSFHSINAEAGGGRALSGETNLVAISPKYISDGETNQITVDPFGSIRMADQVPFFVPPAVVAAGGGQLAAIRRRRRSSIS